MRAVPPESGHRMADQTRRRGRVQNGGVGMRRVILLSATTVFSAVAIGGATLGGAEILRSAQDETHVDSMPRHFGIGRPATAAELARIDIDVRADGRGLPAGSGTPGAGAKIYAARCVTCHGRNGEGIRQGTLQLGPKLIGRNPGDAFDFNQSTEKEGTRTIGNYWPYATTLFDYVRR